MAKYRVSIDKDMSDIVPAFMEARKEELPQLASMLAAGDHAALKKAGHNLKGSGGGYGFDRLTELGSDLEAAALAGDHAALETAVSAIKDYVENVEVVYE